MNNELFDKLVLSIKQAGEIRKENAKPSRIFEYPPLEVGQIRNNLSVSQDIFAEMIGVSLSTVQDWEQGKQQPRGAARTLLKVVDREPELVVAALQY